VELDRTRCRLLLTLGFRIADIELITYKQVETKEWLKKTSLPPTQPHARKQGKQKKGTWAV
jgi:hypothetical protein